MNSLSVPELIENQQNQKRLKQILTGNLFECDDLINAVFSERDYFSFANLCPNKCYADSKELLKQIPSDKRHLFGTLHFFSRTHNIPIKPEETMLNLARYNPEKEAVYWGYHVTVIGMNSNVFDLALDKDYFGIPYETYKSRFLHRVNPYDCEKLQVSLIPSGLLVENESLNYATLEEYKLGSMASLEFRYLPVFLEAANQKYKMDH